MVSVRIIETPAHQDSECWSSSKVQRPELHSADVRRHLSNGKCNQQIMCWIICWPPDLATQEQIWFVTCKPRDFSLQERSPAGSRANFPFLGLGFAVFLGAAGPGKHHIGFTHQLQSLVWCSPKHAKNACARHASVTLAVKQNLHAEYLSNLTQPIGQLEFLTA